MTSAGCLVEYPYVSGTEATPFAIDVSADAPVATRDIVLTTRAHGQVAAVLNLRGVDSRVRVAVTGEADVNRDGEVDGVATFLHPSDSGDLTVPLRANGDCTKPPCGTERLIVELTEPVAGERLTISGDVAVTYGYAGSSAQPGPAMTLEGFDVGRSRPAGVERVTRVTAPSERLDVDHPLSMLPVTFHLATGENADPLDLVSEVRLTGDAAVATDGFDLSLRTLQHDPTVPVLPVLATGRAWAPALGCRVPSTDCQSPTLVRLAWDGTTQTATADYGLESVLVSYADGGLANAAGVTAALGVGMATPAGAPRLRDSDEGTLVLTQRNAELRERIRVVALGPAPDEIGEIPGTVLLTYAVAPEVSTIKAGERALVLSWTSNTRGYDPGVVLVLDGRTHTVLLDLLPQCAARTACANDVLFTIFDATDGRLPKPLTLTYRLDVAVTSFSADPFPAGATVGVGPQPSTGPTSTP